MTTPHDTTPSSAIPKLVPSARDDKREARLALAQDLTVWLIAYQTGVRTMPTVHIALALAEQAGFPYGIYVTQQDEDEWLLRAVIELPTGRAQFDLPWLNFEHVSITEEESIDAIFRYIGRFEEA